MRAGRFQGRVPLGGEAQGRTLGLVGLGNIGAASPASPRRWNERHRLEPEPHRRTRRRPGSPASKGGTLRQADIVTIHLQLSDRTRGIVASPELGVMKPAAFLVNTSRGPHVDETALLAALNARRIGAASISSTPNRCRRPPLPPGPTRAHPASRLCHRRKHARTLPQARRKPARLARWQARAGGQSGGRERVG